MVELPRLPGRNVYDPEAVGDGSRVYVDTRTGEIIETGPSPTRAARLARRATVHQARKDDENARFRAAGARGADACRRALPRRTPPGLERPLCYPWADSSNDDCPTLS